MGNRFPELSESVKNMKTNLVFEDNTIIELGYNC